jgi:hypothetical protein
MSQIRPPRATLIERDAKGGPGVLPVRVRPATIMVASSAFAENRYSKFKLERESIVQNAPPTSGVYGLFNIFWIYVGEANNIRARLLEHLEEDHHACFGRYRPSGFAFESIAPELREYRRSALVAELEPLCPLILDSGSQRTPKSAGGTAGC